MAMKNAIENGDQDAQRVLKTMLRKMSMNTMNNKLNMINHGDRGGLDYIEVPEGEWFKSEKSGELFRYNKGVFEAYPKNGETDGEYKKYHVIKVISDDLVEVSVEENEKSFIVKSEGEKIQWETIDTREEMEEQLLHRNKQHLQQVTKEGVMPMQEWFKTMIGNDGYSDKGGGLLEGDIEWGGVPDDPELRAWLKAIMKTEQEHRLPPIEGRITTQEFMQAFRKAKENTLSSPSGLDYTICKCIASDVYLAEMFATMMSLPFENGFINKRW